MIEQILPRIYRIHVPLVGNPLKELNSYLILGDGENLLIDTGFRRDYCRDALQEALDTLHVCREETNVLCTHMHADHSGLCDVFAGEQRHIYMSEVDSAPMENDALRDQYRSSQDRRYREEGFSEEEMQALVWKNPATVSAFPYGSRHFTPLKDGDVLEYGGYRLQAILTPGHTPGHMCFWMEEQQAMFLGDHVLFDITPNITFWPALDDALGTYMETLRTIRNYDVRLPLPGHRETGDFRSRIDRLLAHHEKRLDQVRSIVRDNPGLNGYEIASRMTWKIRSRSWDDFPVAQKWFAVGECLSHVDRLLIAGEFCVEENNGIRRYTAR